MKKQILFALAVLFFSCAATAKAGEFDDVVRRVEAQTGARPLWIPFSGVARLFVRATTPEGVHDVRLAVYEDVQTDKLDVKKAVAGLREKGWQPFVMQTSQDGEETAIYAKPNGKWLRLLIVSKDGTDISVIQTDVDPEQASQFVDEQVKSAPKKVTVTVEHD